MPTIVGIEFAMRHPIHSVEDLGLIVRAVRKSSDVRQDDLAETVGVSKQFTANVEKGEPTVQMGLVLTCQPQRRLERRHAQRAVI